MKNIQHTQDGIKKTRGFTGQKMIVLPDKLIQELNNHPLSKQLHITHIGYFPKARFHYRQRPNGSAQHILICCVDGKGWFEADGKQITVVENQVILLPAGTPHRYGADKNSPWSIYWVHYFGALAGEFTHLFRIKNPDFRKDITFISDRISLFDEMYDVLDLGFSSDHLNYANTVLWHFLATLCYHDTYQALKSEERTDPVDHAIQFMKNNIEQSLSLADIAEKARLSPSYFSSRFKEKTGHSPVDYFIQLKIQKACQYLDLTSMQVKEISLKTGYSDVHYFSRIFKKIMGCPPSEYRKKLKG